MDIQYKCYREVVCDEYREKLNANCNGIYVYDEQGHSTICELKGEMPEFEEARWEFINRLLDLPGFIRLMVEIIPDEELIPIDEGEREMTKKGLVWYYLEKYLTKRR